MSKSNAIQKPDETPSQIVATYIRFDSHQQHLHSWHELQDCLERLRLWEAEHGNAAAKLKQLQERPAIRRIIIDPSGYIALEFDTFDDRADFCYWIPKGRVYGDTRHNTDGPPYRMAWKLSDFQMPVVLEMTDRSRAEKAAIEEANRR